MRNPKWLLNKKWWKHIYKIYWPNNDCKKIAILIRNQWHLYHEENIFTLIELKKELRFDKDKKYTFCFFNFAVELFI